MLSWFLIAVTVAGSSNLLIVIYLKKKRQDSSHVMSNRRFGIEIECYGISQQRAKRAIIDAGISASISGYNHRTPRNWKVSTDGSIEWNDRNVHGDALEVVSPPLKGKRGLKEVLKVAKALEDAGARVNKTCGFHVHVDAAGLKKTEIYNVAHRYMLFEKDIDQFMPPSRRQNDYCHSMKSLLTEKQKRKILLLKTERGQTFKEALRTILTDDDRYHKCNIQAYVRHGTIEFRQHNGTVDGNKMVNWIKFCLNFVERSKFPHRRTEPEFALDAQKLPRAGTKAWKILQFAKMLDEAPGPDHYVTEANLMSALNCTQHQLQDLMYKIQEHRTNEGNLYIYRNMVYVGPTPPPRPVYDYNWGHNNAYYESYYEWERKYAGNTAVYLKDVPNVNYYNAIVSSTVVVNRAEFKRFFETAIPKFEGDSWDRGLDPDVNAFYENRKLEFLPKTTENLHQARL